MTRPDPSPTEPSVPALVAHRGWPRRYPENTLVGLEAAVEVGAVFVEIDVQCTADGVLVLSHDEDLLRTAGRSERVTDLTWPALRTADVGERRRFGDAFAGTTPAALTEVVELIARRPGVQLFVELKRHSLERFGVGAVVDAACALLGPIRERVTVISFDAAAVGRARAVGGLSIGWILERWDEPAREHAATMAPDWLFGNRRLLPPAPQTPWPGPWRTAVYTVDDAASARELASRGVACVETDDIGGLLAAFRA